MASLHRLDVCVHHLESLYGVEDARAAERLPSYYKRSGAYLEETKPDHRQDVVERYRRNAMFFLKESVDSLYLDRRVRQRCKELGILIRCKVDFSRSLSRHVRSRFPAEWLRKHHPSLLNDAYDGQDLDIDSAFLGLGASGRTITMIVTSLFASIDDMMCETHVPPARSLHVRNLTTVKGDPMTSAWAFVRHYLSACGVEMHAANTIGYSRTTVSSLRRRFGIPRFPNYPSPMRDEAARKLLAASDDDLRLWGLAMNQYWKLADTPPSRETDLEKFLTISSAS